jgi:glucan phosphoethanolaminetransferase (alkaline phosphatase superfamily)
MSNKTKNITGIALLLIFIFYTCSIALFPHKHIINGVVYVHSHPYERDSKGNPKHSHTLDQICTIQILSCLLFIPFIFCDFLKKIAIYVIILISGILNFHGCILVFRDLRLRAPPFVRIPS